MLAEDEISCGDESCCEEYKVVHIHNTNFILM